MNDTLKTIHSLRSIHGGFSAREISDPDLRTILAAAVRAATASARQSYSIIVVSNQVSMKEYLQYVGSKALIFCVDYNRLMATAAYLNHPFEGDSLQNFITGSTDTILAAQTAAIAAKSLGIDSLFTNSIHRGDLSKFYERFNLPSKYCFPLIALILGYASNEHQTRGRLNGPGVVHFDSYHQISEEEIQQQIDDYGDAAKNMGLVFKGNYQDFNNYFDWFFKVWCKPKPEEIVRRKQIEIYEFIKKTGFIDPKYIYEIP